MTSVQDKVFSFVKKKNNFQISLICFRTEDESSLYMKRRLTMEVVLKYVRHISHVTAMSKNFSVLLK
jgi:hypothetical protein